MYSFIERIFCGRHVAVAIGCAFLLAIFYSAWQSEKWRLFTDSEGFYHANDNALYYASKYLWPFPPGADWRAPCGGRASCEEPMSFRASCTVTVTDCNFYIDEKDELHEPIVLQEKHLVCKGLRSCKKTEDPKECCVEVP